MIVDQGTNDWRSNLIAISIGRRRATQNPKNFNFHLHYTCFEYKKKSILTFSIDVDRQFYTYTIIEILVVRLEGSVMTITRTLVTLNFA